MVYKFNLENTKPCSTPMKAGYKYNRLEDNDNLLPRNAKYRQTIGAFLYVSTVTRIDIAAAINILSRRNESPRVKDWNSAKRIIRYLNTTRDFILIISSKVPILEAYADTDWSGDTQTRKSTTGNLFLLGKVQYNGSPKGKAALSSAEAEYVSAANAAQEILWLIKLLEDLNLPQKNQLPYLRAISSASKWQITKTIPEEQSISIYVFMQSNI